MLAQDVAYSNQRARAREALSEARAILDFLGDDTSEARGTSWLISAQINRYESLPGLLSDADQARRHFAKHPPEQLWSGPFKALELAGLGQQIAGHFAAAEQLQRQALAEVQGRAEYSDAWRINPLIRIGECQYARAELDAASVAPSAPSPSPARQRRCAYWALCKLTEALTRKDRFGITRFMATSSTV
ncbi:MAG: hypothetical protein ABI895_11840 [Deltaproteobacteria bacterium]